MAVIPGGTQFVGVNSDVDMSEKKSSQVNSTTQIYTLQDFEDSLSPDLTPITVDGNSVSIAKDPTATTQDTAVIKSSDTNAGIAIVPNGNGAITADIPDGTSAGGNARGERAVDLQMFRTSNTSVASGRGSGIVSGYSNRNTGIYAFLGGGQANQITSNLSTILGGQSNTASSNTHATVVGGNNNTSSGQYSISGGNGNTASALTSVALGDNNVASGTRSIAIGHSSEATSQFSYSYGRSCSATGVGDFAAGLSNTASGGGSVALTRDTQALGFASMALGRYGVSRNDNSISLSSGIKLNAIEGSSQLTFISRGKNDTLASGGTTNISTIPLTVGSGLYGVNITYAVLINGIVGTANGVSFGDVKVQNISTAFKRVSAVNSMVGSVNILSTNEDTSMNTASLSLTAVSGGMQVDFIAPTFTGGGSVEIDFTAKIELIETL